MLFRDGITNDGKKKEFISDRQLLTWLGTFVPLNQDLRLTDDDAETL
jgi:hypothetical protein